MEFENREWYLTTHEPTVRKKKPSSSYLPANESNNASTENNIDRNDNVKLVDALELRMNRDTIFQNISGPYSINSAHNMSRLESHNMNNTPITQSSNISNHNVYIIFILEYDECNT